MEILLRSIIESSDKHQMTVNSYLDVETGVYHPVLLNVGVHVPWDVPVNVQPDVSHYV